MLSLNLYKKITIKKQKNEKSPFFSTFFRYNITFKL